MNPIPFDLSPAIFYAAVACVLLAVGVLGALAYKYKGAITWHTSRKAKFQELCATMAESRAMLKKCGADDNTLVMTDVEKLFFAFLAEASAGGCGSPGMAVITKQIALRTDELRVLADEAVMHVRSSPELAHKRVELLRLANEMRASVDSMTGRRWTPNTVFGKSSEASPRT